MERLWFVLFAISGIASALAQQRLRRAAEKSDSTLPRLDAFVDEVYAKPGRVVPITATWTARYLGLLFRPNPDPEVEGPRRLALVLFITSVVFFVLLAAS